MLVEGETSGRPLEEVLSDYRCSREVYESRLRTFRDSGLAGLIVAAPRPADASRPGDIVRFIAPYTYDRTRIDALGGTPLLHDFALDRDPMLMPA